MENPEGVLNLLDEFAKLKSKEIPNDLEEYLLYVAASGDPVYQWSLIKSLYRQKLINVITEFYEMCPVMDIPRCPNVDPFNYETMKNSLLKRLDSFSSAPFTIQRISELLTTPRKQYNRVDKFMRAIEKNIWVVSTREPGPREPANTQETSNLVNGVTPRVCVTVKHPKRVKSIEERIKSGHPQLIDDDEDEEEEEEEEIDEYEQMEEDNNTDILPNNDADDTSLQCTSVKDLIEKYENGTIFSNAEEKTDFEEKSVQLEEAVGSEAAPVAEPLQEPVPPISDFPCNEEAEAAPAKEVEPDTLLEESGPEIVESVVTADSSSDVTVQEREIAVEVEVSTLDSISEMPVEKSEPLVESSTSSSDLPVSESDSTSMIVETQTECLPVFPSDLPVNPTTNEEFSSAPEPSSSADSLLESDSKEEIIDKSADSECT